MTQNILAQLARVSLLVEMDANCYKVPPLSFFPPLAVNAHCPLELSKYQMFGPKVRDLVGT